MASRDTVTSYMNEYLAIHDIEDSCWNGLQVEGRNAVSRIVTGVTAGHELFEKAAQQKADLVIVHHGHFWKHGNPSLTGWQKERIHTLLKNDISLYAAHLPLDRHEEIGNNALIVQALGARVSGQFWEYKGTNISWYGTYVAPIPVEHVLKKIQDTITPSYTHFPFGNDEISTIAVATGSGGYEGIYHALDIGADMYITGDTAEVYNVAKDAGIHVVFAGHHATEVFGVRALGEHLAEKFNLEASFVDIPSGV